MAWGLVGALAISVVFGALLAAQAPINAQLGRSLGSPISAALVSLIVSTVSAGILFSVQGDAPRWRDPPWWMFLGGGLIGIVFVFGSMLVVPRLGSATLIACVIFGQLGAGLALDHLGAFGLPPHEVNLGRVAAIGCILAGIVLLRVF